MYFGKRRDFAYYTGWFQVCDLGGVVDHPSFLENSPRMSKSGKMSPLAWFILEMIPCFRFWLPSNFEVFEVRF